MPVVSTAKKNAPSNRASRLRTASYRTSSCVFSCSTVCVTLSSLRQTGGPGWRKSDIALEDPAGYRRPPRLASMAALPMAPRRLNSLRSSARIRASVLATMRWFSRISLR
ncbi:hypothetical protein RKD32_005791 [Streptomyces sp. SAI-195]